MNIGIDHCLRISRLGLETMMNWLQFMVDSDFISQKRHDSRRKLKENSVGPMCFGQSTSRGN